MSANGQVIKAAQMFVKQGAGASKSFNLKAEMLYGTTLGIGIGLTWKVSYKALNVWLLPRLACSLSSCACRQSCMKAGLLSAGIPLEREEKTSGILHNARAARKRKGMITVSRQQASTAGGLGQLLHNMFGERAMRSKLNVCHRQHQLLQYSAAPAHHDMMFARLAPVAKVAFHVAQGAVCFSHM